MTTARVICDSVSQRGARLTTLEVTFHRFVLAEFNTHRVFSRNSASSRAIPATKNIERLLHAGPAFPVTWPAEQRGMQGGEELDADTRADAQAEWEAAMHDAIYHARKLLSLGVHKSVTNRLLEPFLNHTAIVSSTEWDNFFKQRCSPLAQPEIRVAAESMRDALNASTPVLVEYGSWHLPYVEEGDLTACLAQFVDPRHVSAARCARVSYLTQDGRRDVLEDEKLYQRLATADPIHSSPFEHVATPLVDDKTVLGNFDGWAQLRHYHPHRSERHLVYTKVTTDG